MNKKEYEHLIAFHPGYYLETLRSEMEITQNELSKRLGTTSKTISKLLNGHINVSREMAVNLSMMFGTSVDLWLNLQLSYDKKILEIERQQKLDKEIDIIKTIDYKYFKDMNVVPNTRDWKEKVSNLCSYLKVSSLSVLLEPNFLVNFRSSHEETTDKNLINSRIWLQTALNIGHEVETKDFNKDFLINSLDEIRNMTIMDPMEFYPRLKEIFAECGVAFVILPHLKNSGINGAVKWINKNKVILAMNDRSKYADIFWFSLFHEVSHVLQQKIKNIIISNISKETLDEIDEKLEEEADDFARETLIPSSKYNEFINKADFSKRSIVKFAEELNIHPCIVLGRIQKDSYVPYWQFTDLKIKYEIQ